MGRVDGAIVEIQAIKVGLHCQKAKTDTDNVDRISLSDEGTAGDCATTATAQGTHGFDSTPNDDREVWFVSGTKGGDVLGSFSQMM